MKALSLWQPWASLVAKGAKAVETRPWTTSYRGPLAIHATMTRQHLKYPHPALEVLRDLLGDEPIPVGGIVAVCELVAVVPMGSLAATGPEKGWMRYGLAGLGRYAVGDDEIALGNFDLGRFAWLLGDVREVRPAVGTRGYQGLWDWDPAASGVDLEALARR